MTDRQASGSGMWAGYATAACAFLFAAVSFYWGFGGTLALDTVGQEAVQQVEDGELGIYLAVWAAGLAKVVGGLAALALVLPWGRRVFPHWMLSLVGWGGAAVLITYGAAQVLILAMVKAGAIEPDGPIDWTGFYGHLYIWDPWFVVWGVLMAITAFYYTRNSRRLQQVGSGSLG
ncbi:MAG: DUF3995 domain-containing protein [Actinomycetota bacterium]|nr:DUF3995 domain-containing protein [Actinomycetota bacterium]